MKTNRLNQLSEAAGELIGMMTTLRSSHSILRWSLCWLVAFVMAWQAAIPPVADAGPKKAKSSASKTAALQGGTVIVWGPQQVVRQPINTTYTATFPLPSGAIAPYTLTISNGAPDGTRKVTQACVKLNGANVLSPTCYHSINPSPQTRAVSLLADNTIQVSLIGSVLTYVTITITAASASLNAPSPLSGAQGQTLTVNLTGNGTHWVAGQTTASFGGEISVNGANPGQYGSINVTSPTAATAQITISPTAALAPRTISVSVPYGSGTEVVTAVDAFKVTAPAPPGIVASTVSTLAGGAGTAGYADGAGATARFSNLAGIAAGANDAIYVADAGNHRIRRVASDGTVTTIAGDGNPGLLDGQGTAARFNNPQGVAVDNAGNVYVADAGNHSIRRIAASGAVTTVAGDGTSGFVNGNGANARFSNPRGVAIDNIGQIHVADTGNHAVRRISALGDVSTLVGDGTPGSTDSPNARFNGLAGIAVDGATIYVYIADSGNHRIRRLDNSNAVITLAGADRGFKDGLAVDSRFADPTGIAVDGKGNLVVADTTNSLVRELDPIRASNGDPQAVLTLAGTGDRGLTDGAGNVARFNVPRGVAVTTSSAVIVADTGNHVLRRILLPPVIGSFSPTQGNIGAPVTIAGNRFDERTPANNTVRFTAAGGSTVTAAVTSVTRTQITVNVPAGAVTGPISVQTPGGTATSATNFSVITSGPPAIADFNPKSGPIGTNVTITGTNFRIGGIDPTVTFQGSNSTRIPAALSSATDTQALVLVPTGAVTGTIQLTTSLGMATTASAFIVQSTQDYTLTLTPSAVTMVQGGDAAFVVYANSPQSNFTQLIQLSATGLPGGVTASFNPARITAGARSTLTLTVPGTLSPTSYSFTVQGVANIDGNNVTRTAGGTLTVANRNGQTTLSGRVLGTDESPISGAVVSLDGQTTMTDAAGSFFLSGVTAGVDRPVQINALNVPGVPAETYPVITEPATIVAGQANTVPYIFYLPKIDWANPGTVNNITTSGGVVVGNFTVTNTNVPGLSMSIPNGTRLVRRDGQPVVRASITPVPIDRVPAPVPAEVMVGAFSTKLATPLVYTSQPGAACVGDFNAQGNCVNNGQRIPVTYPNLGGQAVGTTVPLFYFNHGTVKWEKYGDGNVSADGKTIVPINGAGLPDFSWHFPFTGVGQDPSDPDCGNYGENPVDYATGHKIEVMTDVSWGGARGGLSLTRIFTSDLSNPSAGIVTRFGQGWTDNYNVRLEGFFNQNGSGRMFLPGQVTGRLFSFDRIDADGSLIFKTRSAISQLGDYLRKTPAGAMEYRTKSGAVMKFELQPFTLFTQRLKQILDRNGNTATLDYDPGTQDLIRVTDAVGRQLNFSYFSYPNPFGGTFKHVESVTDPLGRKTRYFYERGQLKSVIDPIGSAVSYGYNQFIWLTSVTDPRGVLAKKIAYYVLDPGVDPRLNGRVKTQTFADGGRETYEYTFAGQIVTGVKITDSLGRVVTKRFDSRGYMLGMTDALGQQSAIERRIEDSLPVKTTGPCGCTEGSRTFDGNGNVVTATNQLNQQIAFEYHPTFNGVKKVTLPSTGDGLVRETNLNYDNITGNLLSVTNALGQVTTFGYDPAGTGMLFTITPPPTASDPSGNTTTLIYDTYGFLRQQVDPLGHLTTFEYDVVGRLKKVSDHYGRFSEFTYDDADRLLTVKDPAGAITTYTYDANGNRIRVKDQLQKEWKMVYDAKNRLERVVDPLGRTQRWEYNSEDELLRSVSPSGRTMRFSYTARGQREIVIDGLGNIVTMGYDSSGDLQTVQDQRGHTTTYSYDPLHRPLTRRDPLGRLATVEYDANGNIRVSTDRLGRRVEIKYDKLNRPDEVRYANAVVNYGYDPIGRQTSVSDAQGTINWAYDKANRLIRETTPQGTVEYDYWDDNQRKSLRVSGRPQVDYEYDGAGRLWKIKEGVNTFTFGYDDLSRRQSLSRPNGVTTSYEFDDVHRLKRLIHTGGAVPEDLQYSYTLDDEIASIMSQYGGTALPQTKTIGAADSANRITQFNGANLSFNNEGQTTTAGAQSYTWDARGRLTQVIASGQTVNYGYDALGRRVSRTDGTGTMTFQYDGDDVVADRIGSSVVDYLSGPGIDEKLRQSGGPGGTSYFLQDHLGSVIGLVGAVNERQQYEGFGVNSGSAWTRYGYTGRERDSATGLLYYRARWYDAAQGRFLTEDPIGFAGGLNQYSYAGNNPLSSIDPMGLSPATFRRGFAINFAISFYIGFALAAIGGIPALIIGSVLFFVGAYVILNTIQNWSHLCGDQKDEFLGGLLGGFLGGLGGGALGSWVGSASSGAGAGVRVDTGGNRPNIRNRVLANIAASRGARESSNFGKYAEFDNAFQLAGSLDASTPRDGATFYSGPGNRPAAIKFAKLNDKVVDDHTGGGSVLNAMDLYNRFPRRQADLIWGWFSERYAAGASGEIHLFVEGAPPDRIFKLYEEPVLKANPKVTKWIYHKP